MVRLMAQLMSIVTGLVLNVIMCLPRMCIAYILWRRGSSLKVIGQTVPSFSPLLPYPSPQSLPPHFT